MSSTDLVPSTGARAMQALAHTEGRQFLTFRISEEEYGIDILRVQEIRSYEAPTRVANAPAFIKALSTCAASSCPSWTCAFASARPANTTPSPSSSC